MYSFREQLAKIGMTGSSVACSSFCVRLPSLRSTLASMDFPSGYVQEVPGDEWDADWTDEIQGVAYHDGRWLFSKNGDPEKRLWVLQEGSMKKLKSFDLTTVPAPEGLANFSFHHFGAVQVIDDLIYIDHWSHDPTPRGQGQVLVVSGDETGLHHVRWILLADAPGTGRVGMVAVVPQLGFVCSMGGKTGVGQVFFHDMEGTLIDSVLTLDPPLPADLYAQGGFWSPNNHLYISAGNRGTASNHGWRQFIYVYSPLNGRLVRTIDVPALANRQELEGCSYAPVVRDGKAVQIHVVLLENEDVVADDDVYFKSFSAHEPDLI